MYEPAARAILSTIESATIDAGILATSDVPSNQATPGARMTEVKARRGMPAILAAPGPHRTGLRDH